MHLHLWQLQQVVRTKRWPSCWMIPKWNYDGNLMESYANLPTEGWWKTRRSWIGVEVRRRVFETSTTKRNEGKQQTVSSSSFLVLSFPFLLKNLSVLKFLSLWGHIEYCGSFWGAFSNFNFITFFSPLAHYLRISSNNIMRSFILCNECILFFIHRIEAQVLLSATEFSIYSHLIAAFKLGRETNI